MNLTTHCPRCATAFLVSEQQLGEAQGWVRCGLCQEVFMAQAHVTAPAVDLATEAPVPHQQETASAHIADVTGDIAPRMHRPAAEEPADTPPTGKLPNTQKRRRPYAQVLLAVLAALLVLQVVVQARHRIVAYFPQSVAWVQSLCAPGHCGLRRISAVAIEDSKFSTTGLNQFHLSATMANQDDLALEPPALALTLTDATDQVLARKTFTAQEWGAKASSLPGASHWPIDLWIQWDALPNTTRVVGYRLQALYP